LQKYNIYSYYTTERIIFCLPSSPELFLASIFHHALTLGTSTLVPNPDISVSKPSG